MRVVRLSFGKKVLLLAIALVTVMQLSTLLPVLSAVREGTEQTADRSFRLAGIVFEEFMRNHVAQLETTVDVLVSDFPFRNAVATRDAATIETVLENRVARAGTDTAVVFDLKGNVIASTGVPAPVSFAPVVAQGMADPEPEEALRNVMFLDGTLYRTITVPVKAPVTIAWVMLGFPIADEFAARLSRLTELQVSIVGFDAEGVTVFSSTLGPEERRHALGDLRLKDVSSAEVVHNGDAYITALRPLSAENAGVYAALQLPKLAVVAAYEKIRNALVFVSAFALLLAISGAAVVSGMVSRPVRDLVAAARRMREGIYTEPVNIDSRDEFGDLAAGLNAMQDAIANREKDIFSVAHHDSLSGLPTRDVIVGKLRDMLEERGRIAVVEIALERFHDIASTLGHVTADQAIRRVAESFRDIAGETIVLGHIARNEFVLVVPDADIDTAMDLIARVRERLRAGISLASANISLQVSAGIALYPDHRCDAPELLRCAAIARTDGDRHFMGIGVYEPARDEQALRQIRIVGDFPAAIRNRDLSVVYQPRIDLATNVVAGAEALVRWHHRDLGRLSPAEFVASIERAGGVTHLTRYVLTEAVSQCAMWRDAGVDVPMSVNISVDDLEDEHLPYYLLELTSKRDIKPQMLTLEVTETAIMRNIETSLAVITCIRELGFRLAIDDFGTGQASLTQLKRIPADELKIDQSFVRNLSHLHDEAIVRATIELAHQFGLDAVAEGVEDAGSLERLRALGCELAQGFHFARPLDAAAFVEWLAAWNESAEPDLFRLVGARA